MADEGGARGDGEGRRERAVGNTYRGEGKGLGVPYYGPLGMLLTGVFCYLRKVNGPGDGGL